MTTGTSRVFKMRSSPAASTPLGELAPPCGLVVFAEFWPDSLLMKRLLLPCLARPLVRYKLKMVLNSVRWRVFGFKLLNITLIFHHALILE